jgi:hypothetical protein
VGSICQKRQFKHSPQFGPESGMRAAYPPAEQIAPLRLSVAHSGFAGQAQPTLPLWIFTILNKPFSERLTFSA